MYSRTTHSFIGGIMKNRKLPLTSGCWWPCEERVLISMLQEHIPVKNIAKVLFRDRMSVHAKIKVFKRSGHIQEHQNHV